MNDKYIVKFCPIREQKIIENYFSGAKYVTTEAVSALLNRLAETIAELERAEKGAFWNAFERARCEPENNDIQTAWHHYKNLNKAGNL
jgi:hypothetical protein